MPRILVADDNTNIQKMVALAFQERGIDVTAVGNGEAAVRKLPDLKPDLILADIFMPVRNGYELCEWVKKEQKFSHIPVILLVGAFDPLDEKEARRVGADGVLKKPFIPPDPLIAMVTSALEKVSKPAEAAKANEAVAPPAPAGAKAETPAKIGAKPLPEFPEPSPEEASLVYGFGTGRRALDDEGTSTPVEAIAPQDDKEAEEEFDGASTTSDWRRNAMDFEISEEDARKPAFSADQDIEASFPSEKSDKEAPLTHVHIPAPMEETKPVVPQALEASPEVSVPATEEAQAHSDLAAVFPEVGPAEEKESVTPGSPEPVVESATIREMDEASENESPATPEPSFAPKATHWMDLMAATSEQPKSDWFASTFGAVESEAPSAQAETKQTLDERTEEKEEEKAHHIASEPAPFSEAAAREFGLPEETKVAAEEEESFFADEPEPAEPPSASLSARADANEPVIEDAPRHEESGEAATEFSEAAKTDWESAPEAVVEDAANIPFEPVAEASTQLISEDSEEPKLEKDPGLIEPPAVHVTPEPLLVNDNATRAGHSYGVQQQDIAPTYSFLSAAMPKATESEAKVTEEPLAEEPAPKEWPVGNWSPEPSSDEKSWAERSALTEAVAREAAFAEHSSPEESSPEHSLAERAQEAPAAEFKNNGEDHSASPEFSASESHEPLATGSALDRDALAEIPFLNPPAAFSENEPRPDAKENHAGRPENSADVNAIVEKVLERIEPQLRELLSKNLLKPLVETILHSELEKKNS